MHQPVVDVNQEVTANKADQDLSHESKNGRRFLGQLKMNGEKIPRRAVGDNIDDYLGNGDPEHVVNGWKVLRLSLSTKIMREILDGEVETAHEKHEHAKH